MAIKITQQQEKWRIEIIEEIWEFPDRTTLDMELKEILDTKEKFGKIRK